MTRNVGSYIRVFTVLCNCHIQPRISWEDDFCDESHTNEQPVRFKVIAEFCPPFYPGTRLFMEF